MHIDTIRTKLSTLAESLCAISPLQVSDQLKALHNEILADHAREQIKEAFPRYDTAVFLRYWDEDRPSLVQLLSMTEDQLDVKEGYETLTREQQQALNSAERCIVYLGTDEEIQDLLPCDNVHEDCVEFDLDLNDA